MSLGIIQAVGSREDSESSTGPSSVVGIRPRASYGACCESSFPTAPCAWPSSLVPHPRDCSHPASIHTRARLPAGSQLSDGNFEKCARQSGWLLMTGLPEVGWGDAMAAGRTAWRLGSAGLRVRGHSTFGEQNPTYSNSMCFIV